jgi:hypothetical protein
MSSSPSPPLRTVTLQFGDEPAMDEYDLPLEDYLMAQLDALLLTIPTLQKVVLEPSELQGYSRFAEYTRESIQDMLPGLKEKGILVV